MGLAHATDQVMSEGTAGIYFDLTSQQRRCSSKAVMQTMPEDEAMLYLASPPVPMAIEQLGLQDQGVGCGWQRGQPQPTR